MQIPPAQACRVVRKITDFGTVLCLNPADVLLSLNLPEPTIICHECARELASEIRDSMPGAKSRRRSRRTDGGGR